MKIIEKIRKFWNETLGQDYTDVELAGDVKEPIVSELLKSREKIDNDINNYFGKSISKSKNDKIVENVKVQPIKQKKTPAKKRENDEKERA